MITFPMNNLKLFRVSNSSYPHCPLLLYLYLCVRTDLVQLESISVFVNSTVRQITSKTARLPVSSNQQQVNIVCYMCVRELFNRNSIVTA